MNHRHISMFLTVIMICAVVALPANVTAQAIPRPQPNGDLLLSDDFDDAGRTALQSFGDQWMRWEVGNGVGMMSSNSADDELSAQYLEPIVADVYIEVDLRIPTTWTDGAGISWRGTNLRESEGTNWHYYHVGVRPVARVVELGLLTEGETDVEAIDSCRLPPSLSNFADFRRLRVEAVGEQFNVFVDGTYVCTLHDATLPDPGLIGLYVGVAENLSSKDQAIAEFRQLRAYAPVTASAATPQVMPTTEVVRSPQPSTPDTASQAEAEGVFFDDFSNSKGGWRLGRTDDGEVRIANGMLLVRNYSNSPNRTLTTPGVTATDTILEVDNWLVDGTDDNWQSLLCRFDGQGSYFSAALSADGYYAASAKIRNELVFDRKPVRSDVINPGKDAINRAKLTCIDTTFSFSVNGSLLLEWNDDRLPAGEFGVAVSSMADDFSEVAFDNFIAIYTIPGAPDAQPATNMEAATAAEAVIIASSLNVRSGPGVGYAKIGAVKDGDRLPVLEATADCSWIKVVTPTTTGWISASYARLTGICEEAAPQPTTAAPQPTTAAPQPTTAAPQPTTAAPQPTTAAPQPTPRPTAGVTSIATQPAPASPLITDFETFGVWRRGDETWGEFRQSSTQPFSGRYAGELTYDFPANVPSDRNYVVFMRSIPIAGAPDALEMQVYGDGSGSFLNVWVKDAGGQVWQFSFGQIDHSGWQRMVAPLDTTLEWPVQPISGGGALRFPLSFHALVLDYPTSQAASGVVYFDDLMAVYPD